jgi:hypothetical protein
MYRIAWWENKQEIKRSRVRSPNLPGNLEKRWKKVAYPIPALWRSRRRSSPAGRCPPRRRRTAGTIRRSSSADIGPSSDTAPSPGAPPGSSSPRRLWGRCYDLNFLRFLQISAKKLAFFSKTMLFSNFSKSIRHFSEKRQFFRQIFRRKYFKNHNIGPWKFHVLFFVCENIAQL